MSRPNRRKTELRFSWSSDTDTLSTDMSQSDCRGFYTQVSVSASGLSPKIFSAAVRN